MKNIKRNVIGGIVTMGLIIGASFASFAYTHSGDMWQRGTSGITSRYAYSNFLCPEAWHKSTAEVNYKDGSTVYTDSVSDDASAGEWSNAYTDSHSNIVSTAAYYSH